MPHGHAPCWRPVLTVSLLHGPCSWPVCGRSNAHASLARSVCRPVQLLSFCFLELCTLTVPVLHPEHKSNFTQNPITVKITPLLPSILFRDSPKPWLKLNQPPITSHSSIPFLKSQIPTLISTDPPTLIETQTQELKSQLQRLNLYSINFNSRRQWEAKEMFDLLAMVMGQSWLQQEEKGIRVRKG